MNYLAHSFLSNNDTGLLVGNFIADHISGNNFGNLPENIIEGIKLHRKIDAFTDSHPKFKQSKRFFYDKFEKYSGILVDIYFDHLLAKGFEKNSTVSLSQHCKNVYSVYQENIGLLPQGSARFLNYVLQNNIYFEYSSIHGIEKVLFHLSNRINHGILLQHSIPNFINNESNLTQNFDEFFHDAKNEFIV